MTNTNLPVEEIKLYRHTKRLLRQINAYDKTIDCSKIEDFLSLYENVPQNSESDEMSFAYQEHEYLRKEKVVQAEIFASKKYDEMLKNCGEGEFRVLRPFEYIALNPHNFRIKSVVNLPTDFWESGKVLFGNYYIEDDKKNRYTSQRLETIRGAYIAINVEFEPHEKKSFVLKSVSIVNPKFLYKSVKKLFISAIKPSKNQLDLINKFKIIKKTESLGNKTVEVAKIAKISNCFGGEMCKKIKITYELGDSNTIRYINGYFTFFSGSKRVEISIDIAKNNSLVSECYYLQMDRGTCEILIDNKEKLTNNNNTPRYVDKCLILNDAKATQIFTILDNNQVSLIDNLPSIELAGNCGCDALRLNNACLLESRFVLEQCSKDDIGKTIMQHDIDVLALRR